MTLRERAKQFCKENGVCETLFSTNQGTFYTSEILVDFARLELEEAAEEKNYEIDFDGNVLAGIRIKNNIPEVYGAMNGYGDGINISNIKITEQ